mmetsp:Transcript_7394/g.18342  ORF Transcript_7394/g.18342 Transcript_7394/m.18342 type:complete len:212 (+) Transcript_7394:599-1234(+)
MSKTSIGFSAVIPAPISALYATMSGRRPSSFMRLNRAKAGSHCLELAHAVIADVYATLLGLILSLFMSSMRLTASSHRPVAPQVLIADENVNESLRIPSSSMHFIRLKAFRQRTLVSSSPACCFDSIRAAFDSAAIAELYVIALILRPLSLMRSNSSNARSHFPPFPHAITATPYVTSFGSIPSSRISSMRDSAFFHRVPPPFAHASMAVV